MGEKGVGLLIVVFQQWGKSKGAEQWCFSNGKSEKVVEQWCFNNGKACLFVR
jgi:hypothetical protein